MSLPWKAILCSAALTGCTGIPDGTQPVTGFELDRYLGQWYEIARLDHSFEEGLHCVTANYSLRDDGGVQVINRGYHLENQEWDEAEGRAYFIDEQDVGRLKVSFLAPSTGVTTSWLWMTTTSGRWCQAPTATIYGSCPARRTWIARRKTACVSGPPNWISPPTN